MTQTSNWKTTLEVTLINMTRTAIMQLSSMLKPMDVIRLMEYHIIMEVRQWELIHKGNEDLFDYDGDDDVYWGLFFLENCPVKYSISLVDNSNTSKGQMVFCPILAIQDREVRILFQTKYN